MRMFKCCKCGEIFSEDYAGTRKELVDSGPGYKYYENYVACPECNSDELDEFEQMFEACEDFDCEGDCEACELRNEIEKGEDK